MITFKHVGNFKNSEKFLKTSNRESILQILSNYGQQGVLALSSATPIDSGETSKSWAYEIKTGKRGYRLVWTNSNISNGIPIVVLLQYGHGTSNGTFVEGRDFINPALRPILDKLSVSLWEEVKRL